MSDDNWAAEKNVDIPTNRCVSGCGNHRSGYHHCDAPIFDAVVPELLAKLVPMVAAWILRASKIRVCLKGKVRFNEI